MITSQWNTGYVRGIRLFWPSQMVSIPGPHPTNASSNPQSPTTKTAPQISKMSSSDSQEEPKPVLSSHALPTSGWYQAGPLRRCSPGNWKWHCNSKIGLPGWLPQSSALGQEKQKEAGRRTKQPDRWRRRGSQGSSWSSQSLHPRLQAAPGSSSCSPDVTSPLLFEASSGTFHRLAPEGVLINYRRWTMCRDGHPPKLREAVNIKCAQENLF